MPRAKRQYQCRTRRITGSMVRRTPSIIILPPDDCAPLTLTCRPSAATGFRLSCLESFQYKKCSPAQGSSLKRFSDLSEREILALAITNEEEDSRIYRGFAEGLRENYAA